MPISVPPYMPMRQQQRPNIDIEGSISGLGDALQQGLEFRDKRRIDRATREAFASGMPTGPDGSPDYNAMAAKFFEIGNIDAGLGMTRLAETQVQNQYLRGRPQYMPGPGGGIYTEPTVPGEQPREVIPGRPERPMIVPAGSTVLGSDQEPVYTAPPKPTAARAPTIDAMRNKQLLQVVTPDLATVETTFAELSKPENQYGARVPGAGNYFVSAGYQQGRDALGTIIASYLYSMSGATANPGEVETQTNILMPKEGDEPATIANKLARIRTMVGSIKTRSGGNAAAEGEIPPDELIAGPEAEQEGEIVETGDGRFMLMPDGSVVQLD